MKYVAQENKTGCGIACVAMVAGVSYSEAMKIAQQLPDWPPTKRTFYTNFSELRQLLSVFSIKVGRKITTADWGRLPKMAIAAINHKTTNGANYWHWVVFCRESDGVPYVLDPNDKLKIKKRTDFWRMKLHAYIGISSEK